MLPTRTSDAVVGCPAFDLVPCVACVAFVYADVEERPCAGHGCDSTATLFIDILDSVPTPRVIGIMFTRAKLGRDNDG